MQIVYMCLSTDIIHTGHINIIQKAAEYGAVIVGVLCDECVAMYERSPIIPIEERMKIVENIKGVSEVVVQNSIFYDENIRKIKPDFVVHGENWQEGYQAAVRERAIEVVKEWGGKVIELPYYQTEKLALLNSYMDDSRGLPELRRQRLRRELVQGKLVRIMVAYDGLSALMVENTYVENNGKRQQFDGMWMSSLCDSTVKGKPDIELVDLSSRMRNLEDIMEVTTKPIIFDADTGGLPEHFAYNIKTLERVGVSAVIIEDKIGLKRNSLLGNEVEQHQADTEDFCDKIRIGKKSIISANFMLIARIESLILEKGVEDALERARLYVKAGADGIMIHSRRKEPDEIFEFADRFRQENRTTPLVAVPTTYNQVYESKLKGHGFNIVIYANHMLRAAFPAMQKVLNSILKNERCYEASADCMSIKDILELIPME